MTAPALTYRACTTADDFEQCMRVQKGVWNFDDIDMLPARLFVVAKTVGGQNFGAFDGDNMAGFVLALPGLRHGRPYFHSHMLGVLPEYRDRHVGRTLKLMQRDDALARGVTLVEWTFDPLEVKNAFFNIERLGVIVRRYVPNFYGTSSSALQGGLPTDRLVAEWWLDTPRVKNRVAGIRDEIEVARRVGVPADIVEIKQKDRRRALQIQTRLREEFEQALEEGLMVAGFDPKGEYLFTTEAHR